MPARKARPRCNICTSCRPICERHGLWSAAQRKRTHLNHVLARAELQSNHRPNRQLWLRRWQGMYLPKPWMRLRQGEGWV